MTVFHILYRKNGVQVLYCSIENIHDYRHHIIHRPQDGSVLYVFYFYKESVEISGVHSVRVDHDLTAYLAYLKSKHDRFSGRDVGRILELYDILHSPPAKPLHQESYVRAQIARIKDSIRSATCVPEIDCSDQLCSIMGSIPDIDWSPDFVDSYWFETSSRVYPTHPATTLTFHDVYYMNKQWYDSSKQPITIEEFQKDFEYCGFKGKPEPIETWTVVDISEAVFLDYIYDFYNFGEFWDIVKRLLACTKNAPLFCVRSNRVTDFQYYIDRLGFACKYVYERDRLYHFDTVHICVLQGGSRGCIDRFDAYSFHRLLNPSIMDTPYILYLSRGAFGRGLVDEEEILAKIPNVTVINGSETREQLFHYFTNAILIFGVHGSLMKNMIWCRRSPVCIEICPHTRHGCFMGNSLALGFRTLFCIVDCDEKERIRLSQKQKDALIELVKSLV
jgi:hypothetical protein